MRVLARSSDVLTCTSCNRVLSKFVGVEVLAWPNALLSVSPRFPVRFVHRVSVLHTQGCSSPAAGKRLARGGASSKRMRALTHLPFREKRAFPSKNQDSSKSASTRVGFVAHVAG